MQWRPNGAYTCSGCITGENATIRKLLPCTGLLVTGTASPLKRENLSLNPEFKLNFSGWRYWRLFFLPRNISREGDITKLLYPECLLAQTFLLCCKCLLRGHRELRNVRYLQTTVSQQKHVGKIKIPLCQKNSLWLYTALQEYFIEFSDHI